MDKAEIPARRIPAAVLEIRDFVQEIHPMEMIEEETVVFFSKSPLMSGVLCLQNKLRAAVKCLPFVLVFPVSFS